jgi:hypothetical protein
MIRTITKGLLIAGTLLGLATLAWWRTPVKSPPVQPEPEGRFPRVAGSNLDREDFELPRDFAGELNLVFIAFQQWQQASVDTWVPLAQQLERDHPTLRYYELPTIQSLPSFSRKFINEGMRAGIPDSTARERTVTLYLDKAAFQQQLDIPDDKDVHVILVTRDGEILWRTTGDFSDEKGQQLQAYISDRRS